MGRHGPEQQAADDAADCSLTFTKSVVMPRQKALDSAKEIGQEAS